MSESNDKCVLTSYQKFFYISASVLMLCLCPVILVMSGAVTPDVMMEWLASIGAFLGEGLTVIFCVVLIILVVVVAS